MYTIETIKDCLDLPQEYIEQICAQLEISAKSAIDDSDFHSGRRILSLIICIRELKQENTVYLAGSVPTSAPTVAKQEEPAATTEQDKLRPRYSALAQSDSVKEMREAIVGLIAKKLLNINVDISTRSFYSIMERHYLSNIESSKLDTLMLPMSESRQDRPRWKEIITQALIMLIEEGYLAKLSRYTYSWTDLAKQELVAVEQPVVESKEEPHAPVLKERLSLTELKEVAFPQPFASFTKPRMYGQETNGNSGNSVRPIHN